VAIISAAQARAYIPSLSGDSDDSTLDVLISRFDSVAASFLGFPKQSSGAISIESGTYVEYLDGRGGREIRPSVVPIVSVTSIHDDPDLDYTDSADLIAASDYTIYGDEGRIILDFDATDAAFSNGERHVKITYVAGYSGATMPSSIQHAAAIQVAHWYQARAHIGKTNVSSAGQSAQLKTLELLPEVKHALGPFRLASVWVG
tara:strand:+ start:1598 stop:2206 length:609 start_codon:yes stop_codon:yes gene_type:complete